MQTRISKTLEGAIARTAFDTAKADVNSSLKDYLMLELIREEGSLAYQILASRLGHQDIDRLRLRIGQALKSAGQSAADTTGNDSAATADSTAQFFSDFAEELRHTVRGVHSISTAHAMLNIAEDPATATAAVLAAYGLGPNYIAGEIARFSSGGGQQQAADSARHDSSNDGFASGLRDMVQDFGPNDSTRQDTRAMLDRFGQNLTQMAREGRIDPVIGREKEIERVVQILSRRKKNTPILI